MVNTTLMYRSVCLIIASCLLVLPKICLGREQISTDSRIHAHDVPVNRQCEVDNDIMTLRWDAGLGEYLPVDDDKRRLEKKSYSRRIRGLHFKEKSSDPKSNEKHEWIPGIRVTANSEQMTRPRLLQDLNDDEVHLLNVRACRCTDLEPVVCPLQFDLCSPIGVDSSNMTTIGCFSTIHSKDEFAGTCLVLSTVWFILLFACLGCTECGRGAIHFLRSKCKPDHSENLADYMLQHRRHRAFLLIHRNITRHRWLVRNFYGEATGNENSQDAGPRTMSLALKTHIHQNDSAAINASDNQEEEDFDSQCIICFQQLETGDCVGDLACGHNFHSECLKTWLKQRNTCPLCNAKDVALSCGKPNRPRAQTQSTAPEGEGEGSTH